LDDLVAVARYFIEQDQDGRSNVAATKSLTAPRRESASEHVVTSTKRSSAVSTWAAAASAAVSPVVFVKFVIH
jgi:hypothetical protein